jgi:hypothetical protein
MARNRSWCFTINNPLQEDLESLYAMTDHVKFGIAGQETGAEGTVHLQGYVQFTSGKTLSAVSTLLPRAHLEVAKGTAQQNYVYCTKDGEIVWEDGSLPTDGGAEGAAAEKNRWAKAKEQAMAGDFDAIDPQIYWAHYSTMKRIYKDHQPTPADADGTTGHWYYGAAGAGKSRAARANFPGAYLKMCNKWWDGYQGQPDVIIDDVDTGHAVLGHHLKIWGDRYAFIAEMKGEARQIRPQNIVVTSQYHPTHIWQDEETRAAILRRYKVTKFSVMEVVDNT